jgi:hypothetical protein
VAGAERRGALRGAFFLADFLAVFFLAGLVVDTVRLLVNGAGLDVPGVKVRA